MHSISVPSVFKIILVLFIFLTVLYIGINSNKPPKNFTKMSVQKFHTIDEFLIASDEFSKNISTAPTIENWIRKSMNKETLDIFLEYANSAYPILHEDVLVLCEDFLNFKKQHGTFIEKRIYESMAIFELIDRLISKVCVYAYDDFILLIVLKNCKMNT